MEVVENPPLPVWWAEARMGRGQEASVQESNWFLPPRCKSGEGEFWIDEGKVESTEFLFGRNQSENGSEAERRPELAPSSLFSVPGYIVKSPKFPLFSREGHEMQLMDWPGLRGITPPARAWVWLGQLRCPQALTLPRELTRSSPTQGPDKTRSHEA